MSTVTNQFLAQMPAKTIKGNDQGSTAGPFDLTVAQVNAILPVFTSVLNGLVPFSGGGTTNFLRADGTWTSVPGVGAITALTGDVTATGPGSAVTTVAAIQSVTVSGVTGTNNVVFSATPTLVNPIVGTQSQSDASTKAASTAYVTTAVSNAVAGINPAVAVLLATTAAGDTSSLTYSNGAAGIGATLTGAVNTALTFDGTTLTSVGQRILVKNDTQSPSGAFNGVYYLTQLQTGILAPILTRALDYNTTAAINNTGVIPIQSGTVNAGRGYLLTSTVATIGTDALTYTLYNRNTADYLLVANNLSDVGTKATAFNNISPVTSTGDFIIGNGSNSNTRLAKGTQYQVLQATATTAAYDAVHLDQAAAITGVLPIANGGSGSATTAANKIFAGPVSGGAAAPSFRAQVSADLPLFVTASYYASAANGSSTTQSANFDTKINDNGNNVTAASAGTGTWKFTAPTALWVTITLQVQQSTTATTQWFVYKNGTAYACIGSQHNDASQATTLHYQMPMAASDYIDFRSGASITVNGGSLGVIGASAVQIHGFANF